MTTAVLADFQASMCRDWASNQESGHAPHWSPALKQQWPTLKLLAVWHGWQVVLATDGKGPDTELRRIDLGKAGFEAPKRHRAIVLLGFVCFESIFTDLKHQFHPNGE